MWTTFLVALKANLRNRSALFWMTVFPIVLATMFNGLFGGLAEAYELKPVPMAVIEDTRWQQADGARTFVDALAGETESASDDTTYAEIDQKLLTITTVDTVKEAEQRLADGTANGYLTADNNGRLAMTVSRETAVTAKDSTQNSGLDIQPRGPAQRHRPVQPHRRRYPADHRRQSTGCAQPELLEQRRAERRHDP